MAGPVLERVLAIVTEGSKLGTHKLALLLAILDACIGGASTDGAPPSRLRSADLARRVLALHWRHTLPFALDGSTIALRQVSRSAKGPHAYLREVAALRKRAGADETTRIEQVIAAHPAAHADAVARVYYALIKNPIDRLQTLGEGKVAFL
jgi:hypothetical protein